VIQKLVERNAIDHDSYKSIDPLLEEVLAINLVVDGIMVLNREQSVDD
jgi:hypothetical protein